MMSYFETAPQMPHKSRYCCDFIYFAVSLSCVVDFAGPALSSGLPKLLYAGARDQSAAMSMLCEPVDQQVNRLRCDFDQLLLRFDNELFPDFVRL